METGISQVIKSGNGNALIFTAIAAAAIANICPTPMDGVYFSKQQQWKQQLENGELSVEKYWLYDAVGYYSYTTLWYVGLFGLLYTLNNSSKTNVKILSGLIGAGIVASVIYKNIKKDNDIADLKKIAGSKVTA